MVFSSDCAANLPSGTITCGWIDVDLPEQKRFALRHFIGLGIAVAGRTALDDVGDVDLVAGQADGLDDLREQLPGAAHEGLAALVFFFAGRLAHEHQSRFRMADAKDDLRAAERAQFTTTTIWPDVGFDEVRVSSLSIVP